ncbi:unnamed protein product [Rotaria sp. Silwood2]|nr:unnamed protein product [Rotaria sp. Silwood2]CAF4339757.1 unnamed protein product [Rotaria sp. Silwood2]
MQSPNNSDDSSHSTETFPTFTSTQTRRISSTQSTSTNHPTTNPTTMSSTRSRQILSSRSTSTQQPKSNPHKDFLTRTEKTCPEHLTESQRNRWFKTAKKAKQNAQLVQQLPAFHWPPSHSNQPIFIHHLTPHSTIQSVLEAIRDVTVYVIDTESDPPTQFQPAALPALIQIEAIHSETSTTVLLIETQFLPFPLSPTHHLIQQLCQHIFSPQHHIVSWGNVLQELSHFKSFTLFDIHQIQQPINLQAYFTDNWNQTHPHLSSCPIQQHRFPITIDSDSDSDVDLICTINTSDFDDFRSKRMNTQTTCTCPDDIRPYKKESEQWALQRAIKLTFNEALNKLHTMNTWACGLDPLLTTTNTSESIATRIAMTSYAINDVSAPTRLLFQLNHEIIRPLRTSSSSPLLASAALQPPVSHLPEPQSTASLLDQAHVSELPSYFVLADSHGRHIEQPINTPHYTITRHFVSGLKWFDPQRPDLNAFSLIQSSHIASYLHSAQAIMLIIGTNSLRFVDAAQAVQHAAHTIKYIHTNHPHLNQKQHIAVVATFPCYNTSNFFPSTHSLLSNIQLYNEELTVLSNQLNFTFIDFHITDIHLNTDRMHLHPNYHYIIPNSIIHYFNRISQHQSTSHTHTRSQSAIQRRNQRRHAKLKLKQHKFSIKRPIDLNWKPIHVKQVLKQHTIKPTRILEVRNHIVTIQFTNAQDRVCVWDVD